MIYPSRRNLVRRVEWNGRTAVRKLFASPDDWQQEWQIGSMLSGCVRVPEILASVPGVLLMEHVPGRTLLDELERQEREGFSPNPWLALRSWLHVVHDRTGLCPGDGNLRNFLWHDAQICGIDFEGYRPQPLADALSEIAAFVLEYTPRNTAVKQQAARILFPGNINSAREALLARRRQKPSRPADVSFLLLCGGKSTRMQRDKASLPFLGTTLLEFQLDKARLTGCRDILIGGARHASSDAKTVSDLLPDRGPLGGLHAGLRAAAHRDCIVLGVDMPLLPVCELRAQLASHRESGAEITLAQHDGKWEPLAGVYASDLSDRIAPMIESAGAPVRALLKNSDCRFRQSSLPESFWANCNTPDEWQSLFGG